LYKRKKRGRRERQMLRGRGDSNKNPTQSSNGPPLNFYSPSSLFLLHDYIWGLYSVLVSFFLSQLGGEPKDVILRLMNGVMLDHVPHVTVKEVDGKRIQIQVHSPQSIEHLLHLVTRKKRV
jgi:hypothetical protein